MDEQNTSEWQAPPPPELIPNQKEPAQMSEVATLGNIFIEPGNTFADLRRKPRFIIAGVIIALLVTGFVFAFNAKMGDERIKRFAIEQMDKNPQMENMPPAQRESAISMQMTITKVINYVIPIFVIIGLVLGGLIYWLGGKIVGSEIGFFGALAVFVYSSFPQSIISMLVNGIVLFLKNADDINIATSQRGLIQVSPAFFVDGKEMPLLATILGTFDVFQIWGWVLAAIGLRVVGKMSKGAAWGVVMVPAGIFILYRIGIAAFTGNPV